MSTMMMLSPIQPSQSQEFDSNNHINEVPRSSCCETSDKCVSGCAAYGHVCPCAARAAGRAAHKKMNTMLEDSVLFDGLPQFQTVDNSEIILGSKLGSGGFSNVNACCLQGVPLDESLAIKYLKREVMVKHKWFENGAADLATEACFLARLDHPNIVKLKAVTAGSVESNVSSGKEAGFFIVVDRLVETLYDRIERWQKRTEELPSNIFYRLSKECKETQRAMLAERLRVAVDIAGVMEYLHSLKVIFRDLKPDNVGFDKDGTLKLFDFGLAKEQKPSMRFENGTYKMTGKTGSRRYMAPEVGKGQPYEKSVDVYSFGILLWELCSLEKPFAGYSSKKHYQLVMLNGERPKMDSSHTAHWPAALQCLMKACWSANSETRPAFSAIKETLEDVIADLSTTKSNFGRSKSDGHKDESSTPATHIGSLTSHIKKPPRGWLRRARS